MSDIYNGFEPFFKDVSVNKNIIPLESSHEEKKTKSRVLMVDSRDRDRTLYPDINSYCITLNEVFENVVSVEVLNVCVPFKVPIIDQTFSTLTISTKINDQTPFVSSIVELPSIYTSKNLSKNISLIADRLLEHKIGFDYINLTQKVQFTKDTTHKTLKINFNGNTRLAALFGFKDSYSDYSTSSSSITSDKPSVFESYYDNTNNYIVMKIKNIDIYKSNNKVINKASAIIHRNQDHLNVDNSEKIIKNFNPPLSIFNLDVKFLDYFGNKVNLEDDHSFQLKITTLKQGRRL